MNKDLLHDWTLLKIDFDWKSARVRFEFEDSKFDRRLLVAEGVRELRIPKLNEWGPSVSVNEVSEVEVAPTAGRCLHIEMQSGDVIHVVAQQILFPIPSAP